MADDIPFTILEKTLQFIKSPCQERHLIVFPCQGEILVDALRRPVIHITNLMMAMYLPLSYGRTNLSPVFLIYLKGKYHYNASKFKGRGGILSSWFIWWKEVANNWEALHYNH
ncbi:hypothetical protein PSTG_09638 [Puccinia striiformis f. sp. tritici PST-78]|uniref:Uncharacterized protein n=1 Tax=Puccinia striiformis f. sp. tritici PST-78 TaxID=1165861 RepID=A0A0L0VCS0_9BASI|nr:hypothetical protein PSTG_09638 [Puccinia striiformis f. sp. tritici PST-78]